MATNAAPEPSPPELTGKTKLSAELIRLRTEVGEHALTLGDVIAVLGVRAYLVLMVLLALPFVTPLPLPFISTPFGLAIAGIALRIALGKPPELSSKLRAKVLPSGFINRLLAVAAGLIRLLEKQLRPRLGALVTEGPLIRLHATMMLIAAGVLLLPLFVPLSNAFPALCIVLISAGLLERDGLAVIAGYVSFAAGVFYFIFLGESTVRIVEWLTSKF